MKYIRLSLKNVIVFVFVFAATFLFYIAPRQAMAGPIVVSAGTIAPDPITQSCTIYGLPSTSCLYSGVGIYTIGYTSASSAPTTCVVSTAEWPAKGTQCTSISFGCAVKGKKPYGCELVVFCLLPIINNPTQASESLAFEQADVAVSFICVQ